MGYINGNEILFSANVSTIKDQEKNVIPTTQSQTITPDEGFDSLNQVTVEAVTSSIDSNITPTNIRAGVSILGVEGNLEPDKPDQTKTVVPIATELTVSADTGYELASVIVKPVPTEDIELTPTQWEETVFPSRDKFIRKVVMHAVDSSIDPNIIPENIKSGVTILGVTGTMPNGQYNVESVDNGDGTQTLNITDYDFVPTPTFDPVFGNNTSAQLTLASADISSKYEQYPTDGEIEAYVLETYGWSVGDTIDVPKKSGGYETHRILAFNHDDKSDGTGKAGICLQMVDCLASNYKINDTNTVVGGFGMCTLRTQTFPTLKADYTDEWQAIMKSVNKKYNHKENDSIMTGISTDDLFLLSKVEIDGIETSTNPDEGTQYSYWVGKIETDRIKKIDSDGDGIPETEVNWLQRSVMVYPSNTYRTVSKIDGSTSSNGIAAQAKAYISLAFNI